MVAALMNDTATVARVSVTSTPMDPTWKAMMSYMLTVVGSDSGTGAGIKADIKVCGALGTYCSSIVTAQNNIGVQGVHPVMEEFVKELVRLELSDMKVDVRRRPPQVAEERSRQWRGFFRFKPVTRSLWSNEYHPPM